MTPETRLVADLGGTKIAVARVTPDGAVHARNERPTPRPATPDVVIDTLTDLLDEARADGDRRVGVASTGRVAKGHVHAVNPRTLPGWEDVNLASRVAAATGLEVDVANDAHAAAYGEWRFGAGEAKDEAFAFVTLSTGVGAGVVVAGRPWTGANGMAAHLGFMPCRGRPDYLEAYASGRAIERLAQGATGRDLSARDVVRQAAAGDAMMSDLLDDLADEIAVGLLQLQWIVDPARIAVGGGLGLAEGVLSRIQTRLESRARRGPGPTPVLTRAQLGTDAGLIGMAAWPDARAHD